MNRFFLYFFVALGLLSASATAQMGKAHGKLYTRIESGALQVTVVIEIEPDFHLYHKELGAPDSVGKPLVATLQAEGVEFDELVWPEPHRFEQPDIGDGGRDTFILGHSKELVLYGHAMLEEGRELPEVSIKLNGLTCMDDGVCLPYRETLKSKGAGKDSVWADYPADAWAPEQAPAASEMGENAFSMGALAGPDSDDGNRAHGELFVREDGDKLELALVIDIDPKYHLYHKELGGKNATGKPLKITLEGDGITFDELTWPEPHRYAQEDFIDGGETYILGFEEQLAIYGTATLGTDAKLEDVRVVLDGQTCEDSGTCLLYMETLSPSGAGDPAMWAELQAMASAVPDPAGDSETPADDSGPTKKKKSKSLWGLILAAIGGGIFALLMPCTYPMIPITISFFTKQAEARGGNVLALSLLYGLGIVLIFVVIGVLVGPIIMRFATHPITNLVMGSMFVLFAAALFGAITLNPPASMMNLAGKASMKGGLVGVFLMGMTLVLTSFTCTAPFVGTLLSVAAAGGEEGGMLRVALGMGVFGLTMAIPFTVLAMVPGKIQALPSSGEWMDTLKVSLGFIELAAALKFFSNVDLVWGWGFLSRELFLLLWAVIFVLGGAYLMGWIRVKGHVTDAISSGRMLGATGFLLFGAYCWHGYTGDSMDNIMTAIIPPYSSAPTAGFGGTAPSHGASPSTSVRAMVVDDHEQALALAVTESKPVLINFTGFM